MAIAGPRRSSRSRDGAYHFAVLVFSRLNVGRPLGLLFTVALCLAAASPAASQEAPRMSDFFHWRPAVNATGWLIFLPGSDGLRVLGDDHHYFDVAGRLGKLGWSVLLVDYKPAYRAAATRPEGPAASKIEWVAEQAIAWVRSAHPETSDLPGALVGWSLGAEGVLRMVNDPASVSAPGIRAAVVYYPSNQAKQKLSNRVPLLVLSGEADDVSRPKAVEAFVQGRAADSAFAELHLYPGARHAFDVASLHERKTVRLLPLIGPKATFQYNDAAAVDAERRLTDFLALHVLRRVP